MQGEFYIYLSIFFLFLEWELYILRAQPNLNSFHQISYSFSPILILF